MHPEAEPAGGSRRPSAEGSWPRPERFRIVEVVPRCGADSPFFLHSWLNFSLSSTKGEVIINRWIGLNSFLDYIMELFFVGLIKLMILCSVLSSSFDFLACDCEVNTISEWTVNRSSFNLKGAFSKINLKYMILIIILLFIIKILNFWDMKLISYVILPQI